MQTTLLIDLTKMITEIITFQLQANADLADLGSPATTLIRKFLAVELATHGAQNAYYGQFIEKPETAIVFLDWDSEDHENFRSSPYVGFT